MKSNCFFGGSDELRMLIESAKQHNINFVYALSPGLDIIYSNPEDVNVLKMKLDQVSVAMKLNAVFHGNIGDVEKEDHEAHCNNT